MTTKMNEEYRIELEGLLEDLHCHADEAEDIIKEIDASSARLAEALENARIVMQQIDRLLERMNEAENAE